MEGDEEEDVGEKPRKTQRKGKKPARFADSGSENEGNTPGK